MKKGSKDLLLPWEEGTKAVVVDASSETSVVNRKEIIIKGSDYGSVCRV
jgi:hypothetical protein